MNRTRGSRRVAGTLLGATLLLTACGGSDDASDDTAGDTAADTAVADDASGDESVAGTAAGDDAAAVEGGELIYITPNPIGVNPFLSLGELGTERAAEEIGGTSKTFESSDDSTRRANVEAAVEEAPDVIVLTSFQLVELADEFSKANPDQEFVIIDSCPDEPAANLHCGVFREHEGAYLLGIMAGNLSESGQIGSVVATDIPFLHRWSDSFALGAQSVNESVTDSQVFIGGDNPFGDPARAKEQALALAAQGADHIFAVGAGSNGGIYEAASEQGFFAYGVDVNECDRAPGQVVDNNLKLVDTVVADLTLQVLAGEAGSIVSFGLAEGGVGVVALSDGVADSGCVIADHPDVIEQVQAANDAIIDGSLVVPDPLTGG